MINIVECPEIMLVPVSLMLEQQYVIVSSAHFFISLDIIKTNKCSVSYYQETEHPSILQIFQQQKMYSFTTDCY